MVTVREHSGDCDGCLFHPWAKKKGTCDNKPCMPEERSDDRGVIFVTVDQYYVLRLKGLT